MAILFEGELFADYHQVYLVDALGNWNLPTNWTDASVKAGILTAKAALIFGTARNMTVPVRVLLHAAEPVVDLQKADHVVIGDLETTGAAAIAGLTSDTPTRFAVPAGNLRVKIVSTGLGTLSADGLDGDDRYAVHLWPGPPGGEQVLRQWPAR